MKALVVVMSFVTLMSAHAGYKGSVSFSQEEKSAHASKIRSFMRVAKNCLNSYKDRHISFYNANCRKNGDSKICLSKFYGDRRYSTKRGRRRSDGKPLQYLGDALVQNGFPASMMRQMENTSCVGMALSCLKQAFQATGQSAQWDKVRKFTYRNNVGGTALQHALQQLGWRLYYWNPESLSTIDRETKKWDAEEKNWKSKGWHNYRYITVKNHGRYWYNKVDDKYTLVGFGDGTPSILYKVPFWVGIAHTGYHVFPGTFENVIEAHSTRHITSYQNLEFSVFSPMRKGGGPRWTSVEKYRSGMIALPPGY